MYFLLMLLQCADDNKENHIMRFTLVDDHQLVRDGFKRLIETRDDWQVMSEANGYHSGVSALENTAVDIAIIDISLPDSNGIELVKHCTAMYPELKTIVVSMYDQNPYVSNALEAGVKGYISKRSASDELLKGIDTVIGGNTYLSQDVLNKLHIGKGNFINDVLAKLTERELEVFPLLAKGKCAKEIAQELAIMPKTAHVHRANIYKKLAVSNNFELLKIAVSSGVISFEELAG